MDAPDIQFKHQGNLAIVAVDKPMLTSLQADRLLSSLRAYREQTGCNRFVIDMAGVDFIDSACIGSLVTFLMEIDKTGGKLILAACQPTVEELLKITGLTTHIPLIASVDQLQDDNDQADHTESDAA